MLFIQAVRDWENYLRHYGATLTSWVKVCPTVRQTYNILHSDSPTVEWRNISEWREGWMKGMSLGPLRIDKCCTVALIKLPSHAWLPPSSGWGSHTPDILLHCVLWIILVLDPDLGPIGLGRPYQWLLIINTLVNEMWGWQVNQCSISSNAGPVLHCCGKERADQWFLCPELSELCGCQA